MNIDACRHLFSLQKAAKQISSSIIVLQNIGPTNPGFILWAVPDTWNPWGPRCTKSCVPYS